jgi:hypothetical protein
MRVILMWVSIEAQSSRLSGYAPVLFVYCEGAAEVTVHKCYDSHS